MASRKDQARRAAFCWTIATLAGPLAGVAHAHGGGLLVLFGTCGGFPFHLGALRIMYVMRGDRRTKVALFSAYAIAAVSGVVALYGSMGDGSAATLGYQLYFSPILIGPIVAWMMAP